MKPTINRRPRAGRLLCWAAAAAVAITLGALLPAGAAHAAVGDSVTCTGTSDDIFTPGLTLTPQTVTVHETDTAPSCISSDPTITATIMHPYSFQVPGAACNFVQVMPGPIGVRWNNGQRSFAASLTYELTSTGAIAQETGTGTITSGEFTGDTIVFLWAYPIVDPLLCLAPGGVTTQDGTLTIQVLGV